ncbi:hypothetical protein ElyMa_002097500 [Elysia marginata]|uniref:Uncharacterized protein n=1 Tax=Elysia marginata TaxID=1093978 RepID=A0AAV4FGS4_9GAST|nr:hypothetical protein ElyMa_002097500 [Elysia marginata]
MLHESQLASYKLAGKQQKTTLVLRFDAMADTSVSTSHLSTPAKVRRKWPSQLRKDRGRLHQSYLLSKENAPTSLNNTESTNQTPVIDRTKITKPSKLDLGQIAPANKSCVCVRSTHCLCVSATFECNRPSDNYRRRRLYGLL